MRRTQIRAADLAGQQARANPPHGDRRNPRIAQRPSDIAQHRIERIRGRTVRRSGWLPGPDSFGVEGRRVTIKDIEALGTLANFERTYLSRLQLNELPAKG
jgi:hypothetical protein